MLILYQKKFCTKKFQMKWLSALKLLYNPFFFFGKIAVTQQSVKKSVIQRWMQRGLLHNLKMILALSLK